MGIGYSNTLQFDNLSNIQFDEFAQKSRYLSLVTSDRLQFELVELEVWIRHKTLDEAIIWFEVQNLRISQIDQVQIIY